MKTTLYFTVFAKLGILNQILKKDLLFPNHFICKLITKRKVIPASDPEGECIGLGPLGEVVFQSSLAL